MNGWNPEELKKASRHLYHELIMLHECARLLSAFKSASESEDEQLLFRREDPPWGETIHISIREEEQKRDNKVIHNALLDSFSIHARNLIAFFYSRPKKGADDVVADHFWGNRVGFPPKDDLLKKTQHWANKYTAHITMTRIDESQKPDWPWTEIYEQIEARMITFLRKVPDKMLDQCLCDWRDERI